MPIKIKVDTDAAQKDEKLAEKEKIEERTVKISLEARKTLDGKIMILDHMHFDIILDTAIRKIVTFPKNELNDEIYEYQNTYFKYLTTEGVLLPESIKSGNVYGSLQADYPEAADEGVSPTQVVLLSTSKFFEEHTPQFEAQEFIENEIEDHFIDPEPYDSTELGEVPHDPKKGTITPHRIRRYLSGYGYY